MPELPEVEVLVRYLDPLLRNRTVQTVTVRRERVLRPTLAAELKRKLKGTTFQRVSRRAKFIVFDMRSRDGSPLRLLGHLGMTGRMYLQDKAAALPRHAAVTLDLGDARFIFEDTRYFGRFTLDQSQLDNLGPEPLEEGFCIDEFSRGLARSRQPIKVKLLDQSLIAGVGNIYASEALFRAGIHPKLSSARLTEQQIRRLCQSIRRVLKEAIRFGSTVPLNFPGRGKTEGLFYYGAADSSKSYEERLRVYDREDAPCPACQKPIRRIVQAARSTFFCPQCQAPSSYKQLRVKKTAKCAQAGCIGVLVTDLHVKKGR